MELEISNEKMNERREAARGMSWLISYTTYNGMKRHRDSKTLIKFIYFYLIELTDLTMQKTPACSLLYLWNKRGLYRGLLFGTLLRIWHIEC